MVELQPEIESAIEQAVEQLRASLIRMYSDGDTGTIVVDVGTHELRVKAHPVRKFDAVGIEHRAVR